MHFFTFKMDDDLRDAYIKCRHELLLFGCTREETPDGSALCIMIGSSSSYQTLAVVAVEHARLDRDRRIAHYFIHDVQEIEKGLALGVYETKAKEN